MAIVRTAASRAIVVCALFALSTPVTAEPQNGWWWNPNESGRGYFIEMTGGVFYLAGYFYDGDGRATWMSASGAITDLYSLTGTLQSYRNGQSVFGVYRRPDAAVDVGPITITFADDTHATMTWPGGTVPIERQIFDEDEASFQPKTGWWWNSAESGSGYSVEIQGNTAFVVAFMYDESGNPVWYLTAGAMSTPTHYEGDWLEYSGGQTLTGPYRAPTTPRHLGRITVDLAAIDDATITFTEGATVKRVNKASRKSPKAGGRSRSSRTRPQLPTPTWNFSQFWPAFKCVLTQQFDIVDVQEAGTFTQTKLYTYYVTFDLLQGSGHYRANPGTAFFDYSYSSYDTHNGCRDTGFRSNITPLSGELEISPYLYYGGRVFDTVGASLTVHTSCPAPGELEEDRPRYILVQMPFGDGQSRVQQPNPFPMAPPPYMHVKNSHREPDGSTIEWEWDCTASH